MSNTIIRLLVALLLCLLWTAGSLAAPSADEGASIPQADNAFDARDYAAAKSLYQQLYAERGAIGNASEQNSLIAHVLLQLGRCCSFLSGQQEEARTWFGNAIQAYPADAQWCADAQNGIAESYAAYGQRDLAIQSWELMIARYPDERGLAACALFKMAQEDMEVNRYAEAAATLLRLLGVYPDKQEVCHRARVALAEALYEQDKTDEAIAVLNQTVDAADCSAGQKAQALLALAYDQLHADRLAAAKATCERILKDYAGSEEPLSSAKWLLVQVMCEDGTSPATTLALVNELRSDAACRQMLSRAQLTLWESGLHWAKDNVHKTEECLTKIIVDCGDAPGLQSEAYCHRACLYIVLKQFDKAAADIDRIGTPYLRFFTLGEWNYHQQKYEEGAANYEKMMSVLPEHRVPNSEPLRALERMATAYSALGQSDREADARKRLAEYEAAHR